MTGFPKLSPALLLLSLGLLHSVQAGLDEAEVFADATFKSQTTTLASQSLSLKTVSPQGSTATISGRMASFNLTSSVQLSSNRSPVQIAGASSARVDFYDAIDLTIPGLAPGAPVILRIAWNINGSASSSGGSNVFTSARALVSAPPLVKGQPKQTWTRESNNQGDPTTVDPTGRFEFDFLIKTQTPTEGNISLTAACDSVSFIDSDNIPSSYGASPSSGVSVAFSEVVSIKTLAGFEIPGWTIETDSLFDYGEGTGIIIPPDPEVSIGPSPNDPHFISLSWLSSPLEHYTIESSIDLENWKLESQVNGTGSVITLDLSSPAQQHLYRVTPQAGSVPTGGALLNPALRLLSSPTGPNLMRIAWISSIHESYILQTSTDLTSGWTSGAPRAGTGGILFTDIPKQGSSLFLRVLSQHTVTP